MHSNQLGKVTTTYILTRTVIPAFAGMTVQRCVCEQLTTMLTHEPALERNAKSRHPVNPVIPSKDINSITEGARCLELLGLDDQSVSVDVHFVDTGLGVAGNGEDVARR